MKALWFADARLPAVAGEASAGGGWVEGLRRALETHFPEVELGVATPGPEGRETVVAGNTTYFSIPTGRAEGRAPRALSLWRHAPVSSAGLAASIEIARSFSPDVVHVHGSEHYFGLALGALPMPCVVSLQGIVTVYERFSFSGLRPTEILREVTTRQFLEGYGPLHAHFSLHERAAVERRVLSLCDDFLGRTEWDRTVLRMLRPEARYHEVGEVLGQEFYGTEWKGGSDDWTLYCTGGASALKGVEILLEALVLLRRSGVRRPRLRLAGGVTDGPMARKIRRRLGTPELRGAVDVLGRCTPAQIAEELERASAFVLPSHMDNSPNTLCEAMLVGTPCIAASVGGVPSLVQDGVDGLLYHDADPYALAGKIDRLLGDPALAVRLGARARETALRRHDPQRVAQQAVDAYRDVLNRWRERGAAADSPTPQEVAS